MTAQELATVFRSKREVAGVSIEEAAETYQAPPWRVARLERGMDSMITAARLLTLLESYGVTVVIRPSAQRVRLYCPSCRRPVKVERFMPYTGHIGQKCNTTSRVA